MYTLQSFSNTPEEHIIPDNAVDLDLPSGTLWANANIDATTTSGFAATQADFGSFLKYGDATNYYSADGYMPGTVPSGSNDAATQWCGAAWQVPTAAQFRELISCCTWVWSTSTNNAGSSVNGYTITGANGNSIFLPATGIFLSSYSYGNGYSRQTDQTRYWTLTPSEYANTTTNYYYLRFTGSLIQMGTTDQRWYGFPIRPVVK